MLHNTNIVPRFPVFPCVKAMMQRRELPKTRELRFRILAAAVYSARPFSYTWQPRQESHGPPLRLPLLSPPLHPGFHLPGPEDRMPQVQLPACGGDSPEVPMPQLPEQRAREGCEPDRAEGRVLRVQ